MTESDSPTPDGPSSADVDAAMAAARERYQAERAKRVRADGNAQYGELTGDFAEFDRDPFADPDHHRDPLDEDVEVLVIGCGFAGMLTTIELKARGFDDVRMVDRAGDFGGTWYWNRYPGCMCDVESYTYLPLLEETGYMPTEKYASAPEIFGYCQLLARHFGLYEHALFQTEVEAREIATWAENVYVKIPCVTTKGESTAELVRKLSADGIKVNVTLCFSTNQALLAARAGAYFVSPFVGRLDDINQDGSLLIQEIAEMFAIHDLDTKVLAASIRTPVHVTQAALAGADIATMPYKVFKQLVSHPLTDKGVESFLADWAKAKDTVGAVVAAK